MKITYEPGDVVKLEDVINAKSFQGCRVILLHQQGVEFGEEPTLWKVKVYPDEGFSEEDSIDIVDERWFIPNFENLKQ